MVTSVLSNRQLRRDAKAGRGERALRQNDGPSEQQPINHPLWSGLSAGGPTRRLGVNIILNFVVRDIRVTIPSSRGCRFVHAVSR